tara:strand:- start:177 stop:611 length:435 start_codon:yes stop_codon:yes gene_type:complete
MKGKFKPKNPHKYKGDPTNVVWRSRWELKVFSDLDLSENVEKWSSEEIIIPYVDPFSGKTRRYFPDVWVKYKDGTQELIEIKPKYQTLPPPIQKNTSKKYIKEVITWGNNSAKWDAAIEYCKKKGYKWKILTEEQLFPNKGKKK